MLKKQYAGIQFSLSVMFKNDKELSLQELLELEASIASVVSHLSQREVSVLQILEDKANGKANIKEKK